MKYMYRQLSAVKAARTSNEILEAGLTKKIYNQKVYKRTKVLRRTTATSKIFLYYRQSISPACICCRPNH